jgi:hypothetical protein
VYAGVPDNAAKFGAAKIPDAGAATLGARAEAAVWKATAGAKEAAAVGIAAAATVGASKVPVAAPPASEARKALPAIAGAAVDIAPAKAGRAAAAIIFPYFLIAEVQSLPCISVFLAAVAAFSASV